MEADPRNSFWFQPKYTITSVSILPLLPSTGFYRILVPEDESHTPVKSADLIQHAQMPSLKWKGMQAACLTSVTTSGRAGPLHNNTMGLDGPFTASVNSKH